MKIFSIFAVGVLACQLASGTTLTEIKTMPTFGAVLVDYQLRENTAHHIALEIKLRKADGSNFVITEPEASLFQIAFVASLQRGQTKVWPQVLLDFAKVRAGRPDPLHIRLAGK